MNRGFVSGAVGSSAKPELMRPETARVIRIGVIAGHMLLLILPMLLGLFVFTETKNKVLTVRTIPSNQLPQPTSGDPTAQPQPKPDPTPPSPTPAPQKPVEPPKQPPKKPVETPNPPPKKVVESKKPIPPKQPSKKPAEPKKPVKKTEPPSKKPEPKTSKYTKPSDIEISTETTTVKSTQSTSRNTRPPPGPRLPNTPVNLAGLVTGPVLINGNTNNPDEQEYSAMVSQYLYERWDQPNAGILSGKRPSADIEVWIDASGNITRWRKTRVSGSAPMDTSLENLFNTVKNLPRKETGPFPWKVEITFQVE